MEPALPLRFCLDLRLHGGDTVAQITRTIDSSSTDIRGGSKMDASFQSMTSDGYATGSGYTKFSLPQAHARAKDPGTQINLTSFSAEMPLHLVARFPHFNFVLHPSFSAQNPFTYHLIPLHLSLSSGHFASD